MVSYLVRHQILFAGPAFSLAECGLRLPNLIFDNPRNHHGRSISIWPAGYVMYNVLRNNVTALCDASGTPCQKLYLRMVYFPTLSVARTVAFTGGKVRKSKIVPAHAMKAYRGSRGIAPLVLNLCI